MRYRLAICVFGTVAALSPAFMCSGRAATTTPAAVSLTTANVKVLAPAQALKSAVRVAPPTTAPPTTAPPTTAPPTTAGGNYLCQPAFDAILAVGGTLTEAKLADRIAWRESRCTLAITNQSRRTKDDSWGPFQINYYGNLRADRISLVGEPPTNTESWERAAANFLKLGRAAGWCHWSPPNYCS